MKSKQVMLAALLCIMLLSGCAKTIEDIIEEEPCVKGTVQEVSETHLLLAVDPDDPAYRSSDLITVSLEIQHPDSVTHFEPGDQVADYFDGSIAASYPAQIHHVYAIILLQRK